jgi:FkbM family methyltransferase
MKTAIKRLIAKYPIMRHLGPGAIWPVLGLHPSIREAKLFLQRVKVLGFYPNAILDIGAHLGEWSWMARSVFDQARLSLIEPQVEMTPFLEKFCAVVPNSKWIHAGAGAETGELTLTIWDDLTGSSFLPEPSQDLEDAGKQRKVPIVTIDNLIEQNSIPIPDLIKVDVQGLELDVLRGGESCFGHTEIFIVEASFFTFLPNQPVFHEIVNFMLERGYVTYDLLHPNPRPLDGALGQVDICFIKQDSRLRDKRGWQ